jgi:hypothetical protein
MVDEMLFNYLYVTHPIEKFQTYLDHLMREVWCKPTGEFAVTLLHPELHDIVIDIYNVEEGTTKGGTKDWLFGPIRRIFDICRNELIAAQRQQLSIWYDHNNDIEALCANDAGKPPATYDDIEAMHADLAATLKVFCTSLFTNVIGLAPVRSRIGDIAGHYEVFVGANTKNKCPYCGFSDIKGQFHERREAYDHFLPKATYPFSSVNFRNLAPMCHDCNSSYKHDKDPINSPGGVRRRAFYSYALASPQIDIGVTLLGKDPKNLQPNQIELQFTAPGHEDEVATWCDLFGIEERYKAKLCSGVDVSAWLMRVLEEAPANGLSMQDALDSELRVAARAPYSDANFLKAAFLTACRNAKIIRP